MVNLTTGETDLEKLLKTMQPELKDGEYVFCTFPEDSGKISSLNPLCTFREDEGITVICSRVDTEREGVEFIFSCRMITLTVHSSLEAVGLTAAVATKLAKGGISANVVAAYYHDHVFVPSERAEEVVRLLWEFSR